MMKIRLKNKHWMIALLVILMIMGGIRLYGGDYLYFQAERAFRKGNSVKALAYFDALIERFPKHEKVPDALYWSADALPSFRSFEAVFYPTRSSVTRQVDGVLEFPQGSLTREERYLRIKEEFPNHYFARHVDYKLGESYFQMGDPRAEEFLLRAVENEHAGSRIEAAFRLMSLYQGQGRFAEALKINYFCQEELPHHFDVEVRIRQGDLLAASGDFAGARLAYEQAYFFAENEQLKNKELYADLLEEGDLPFSFYSKGEEIKDKIRALDLVAKDEEIFVEGIVTLRGEPLANQMVLPTEQTGSRVFWHGSFCDLFEWKPLWLSGEDGTFSGYLKRGPYQFGLRLNYEQAKAVEGTYLQIINGEQFFKSGQESPQVEFRFVETISLLSPKEGEVYSGGPLLIAWEPFPGAVNYEVSISGIIKTEAGSPSTGSQPYYTGETNYILEDCNILEFGAYGCDEKGTRPEYLLGRLSDFDYLGIEIKALNEKGQPLTSTKGLVFSEQNAGLGEIKVQVQGRDPVKDLFVVRDYDGAVKLLEEQIRKDPKDVNALWRLARVYFYGTYPLSDDWTANRAHKDLAKSQWALEKIREIRVSGQVLRALAIVLEGLNEAEKLLEVHRELIERGEPNWSNFNYLAYHALQNEGDLGKALHFYEESQNLASYAYALSDYFRLRLLMGEWQVALGLLEQADLHWYPALGTIAQETERFLVSGRFEPDFAEYLRLDGPSYAEMLRMWVSSPDPYAKFLGLIARILDISQPDPRLEEELEEFAERYGETEEILIDYLEVLMETR